MEVKFNKDCKWSALFYFIVVIVAAAVLFLFLQLMLPVHIIFPSLVFISSSLTCLVKTCSERVLMNAHPTAGQLEIQGEQNQSTCPSYNELFELDKQPPNYEECQAHNAVTERPPRRLRDQRQKILGKSDEVLSPASGFKAPEENHTKSLPPVYEEFRANEISIAIPDEMAIRETDADTAAVRSDDTDSVVESVHPAIEPSQNI